MNNKLIFLGLIPVLMLLVPNVSASIVDYEDEPEEQEQCEERTDYDFLCAGERGATGIPFCDLYNRTERVEQFPNNTNPSHCLSREHNPIGFCQEFDDLTDTYEYCRNVPGTEEYFEYAKTGGPDESCLFDVYQIKCQAFPNMNETARAQCREGFATNEDDYCFPLHSDGCPEGYHTTEDNETGQCYPTEGDTGCEEETDILSEDGKNCRTYKLDCDLNEDNPLCNGEERTDGLTVCDEPDHPGYKFCNDETD